MENAQGRSLVRPGFLCLRICNPLRRTVQPQVWGPHWESQRSEQQWPPEHRGKGNPRLRSPHFRQPCPSAEPWRSHTTGVVLRGERTLLAKGTAGTISQFIYL